MKRILIWLFILITPISLWFALTEDGNTALQTLSGEQVKPDLVMQGAPVEQKNITILKDSKSDSKRILIPAHLINGIPPESQQPYLHIEIKGRNTSSRKVPAGLLLIDNEGRRTGYDPINNKHFQEIPNSKYEIKNEVRVSPPSEIAVINVKPVKPQYYRIEVIGHQEITYELSVSRSPSPYSRTLMAMPRYVIQKENLHSYTVNMTSNPEIGFLGAMAEEPISSSFASGRKVKVEAIDSADMKLDVTLPVIALDMQQQKVQTLSHIDRNNGFRLLYPKAVDVKNDEWNGLYFGKGDKTVLVKVLPHKKDSFPYLFNKTYDSLHSFASKSLPRSIGMSADGEGYTIHPVGIFATKTFINLKGVKGIQTFLVHKVKRYVEGEEKPDISYKLQGPVYLFALKPDQQVSPVLVLTPGEPIGSSRASHPQRVRDMANSVELVY